MHKQKQFGFPGLLTEMKPWIKKLEIGEFLDEPNLISKAAFSKRIKEGLRKECESELLEKMRGYKKLSEGPVFNNEEIETFNRKPYIDELPLANARTKFSYRAKMYNVAFNYKHQGNNQDRLWKCSSCTSSIETQDHVLFCPAYSQLREGKSLESDKDLTNYLMKVLIIREKLNIVK